MRKNIREQINAWKKEKRESMEYGYSSVYPSNRVNLLGDEASRPHMDNLLLSILNKDGYGTLRVVEGSPVTYYQARRKDVRPLISALANVAFENPYGVGNVCYVDIKKGVRSEEAFELMAKKVESLRSVQESSLVNLILVEATTPRRGEEARMAGLLTDGLKSLSPEAFSVGVIATPRFVRRVDLHRPLEGLPEQPKANVVSRPVPVVS